MRLTITLNIGPTNAYTMDVAVLTGVTSLVALVQLYHGGNFHWFRKLKYPQKQRQNVTHIIYYMHDL
jgi:hypothetical protein